VAIAALSSTREYICPGCGRRRTVDARTARRKPQSCNLCRHPGKHKPPDNKDRRFWLQRFSDEEILHMALGIFGGEGDLAIIAYWRTRLEKVKVVHEVLPRNGKAKLRQQVGGRANT